MVRLLPDCLQAYLQDDIWQGNKGTGCTRTPLALRPTQRPSAQPMPRSMASPNASTGIASYASSPAS